MSTPSFRLFISESLHLSKRIEVKIYFCDSDSIQFKGNSVCNNSYVLLLVPNNACTYSQARFQTVHAILTLWQSPPFAKACFLNTAAAYGAENSHSRHNAPVAPTAVRETSEAMRCHFTRIGLWSIGRWNRWSILMFRVIFISRRSLIGRTGRRHGRLNHGIRIRRIRVRKRAQWDPRL